jgi:hypothetical protein
MCIPTCHRTNSAGQAPRGCFERRRSGPLSRGVIGVRTDVVPSAGNGRPEVGPASDLGGSWLLRRELLKTHKVRAGSCPPGWLNHFEKCPSACSSLLALVAPSWTEVEKMCAGRGLTGGPKQATCQDPPRRLPAPSPLSSIPIPEARVAPSEHLSRSGQGVGGPFLALAMSLRAICSRT